MLVLARRLHERILIPVIDTSIEVLSTRAGTVRLGIDAPLTVRVLREELSQRERPHEDAVSPEDAGPEPLHSLLLGLARLWRRAGTLTGPARAAAVDEIRGKLVLLSRLVSLLPEGAEAVDVPHTRRVHGTEAAQ
jgi:carbon storage regulator CsrA